MIKALTDKYMYMSLLLRRSFIPIDQSLVIDVLFCGYVRGGAGRFEIDFSH
jgi:hypothetical protein